jgi:hypothetical protein
MPEKLGSGAPSDASSIDPIAFDDQTIFGLDPAVHWVHWNNQRDQFPEIVLEITKHWNDSDWLEKLLKRLGYTANCYDPATNPTGIFEKLPEKGPSISAVRFFLLRAAGTTNEKILAMFGTLATRKPRSAKWALARDNMDNVINRRKQLAATLKRTS